MPTYNSERAARRAAKKQGGDALAVQIDGVWNVVCENENGDVTETPVTDLSPEDIGDETLGNDDGGPVEPDALDDRPADSLDALDDSAEIAAAVNAEEIKSISAKAIAQIEAQDWEALVTTAKTLLAIANGKRRPDADGSSSYKEIRAMAPRVRSTRVNPVKFIFDHMNANPDLPRKAALEFFAKNGVNYSTAHTQFQKWRKAYAARGATQAEAEAQVAAANADKIDGMDRDDIGESND